MDTQETSTAAASRLCGVRDLELVVEDTYAGSGALSLQHHAGFDSVLRFGRSWPQVRVLAAVTR